MLAPAGVPPAVTQRLNAAINKVMGTGEARDALLKLGQYPMRGTPDDFARHIGSQTERWAQVMQTSHIAKAD
ncbi:Tripartite tricarboxylate transporter family receptor [compost metagenome]